MRARPQEPQSCRRGQALIMVTLSLLAMSGLIGMAVDFGWSYYMRRTAQAAADAGALAAARAAMSVVRVNGASALSCTALSCGAETSCGTGLTGTWKTACQYAQQNGFTAGGDSGRQTVTVAAGVYSPTPAAPPTAPNVNVSYWVTVRVTNTIPQLYSALLGNANATIAARATAAIVNQLVNGSILALNREGDPQPTWQQSPGTFNPDLLLGSGTDVRVTGSMDRGIVLSSNDSGSGTNLGSIVPSVPMVASRGGLSPAGSWPSVRTFLNQADAQQYQDPFAGLGQPPLPTSPLPEYAVPNGNLAAAPACSSGTCPPGVYYATSGGVASGGQLTVSSVTLSFANSSNTWGDYVFYGGLGVTNSTVNFGPGRYVLAGVANSSTAALNFGSGSQVSGGGPGSDAGRVFISTQPDYPGLSTVAPLPGNMPPLSFGQTIMNPGSGGINLYGLNSAMTLPSDTNSQGYQLSDFGPLVVWQDQRYSNIAKPSNTTPQMVMGSASTLDGVIYQPRGAWVQIQPGAQVNGTYRGARLITGAVDAGNNANIFLCFSSTCNQSLPLWTHVVALVE